MKNYEKVLALVDGEVIVEQDNVTGIAPAMAIADDGILDTGIDAFLGHLAISTDEDGAIAGCSIASGVQVIDSVTGSAVFSDAKSTDTKINVYVEDGTVQVENLTGAEISVKVRLH